MKKTIAEKTAEQIGQAYRAMAETARYRPMAPSDGVGNIIVPREDLDLDAEIAKYVPYWLGEEDTHRFDVGVPGWPGRSALIFTIEAARNICGVAPEVAAPLLRLALAEIEKGNV